MDHSVYRDNCQSGGSVITKRLYINVKQDFFFKKKRDLQSTGKNFGY